MRAIYLETFDIKDEIITVVDDSFHHLKNVCRVKTEEDVLVLDGNGLKIFTKVKSVLKKQIELQVISKEIVKREPKEACASVVKKEALEIILKKSIELGITKLFLVNTERSPKLNYKDDRFKHVLVSALEQSNNPFLLEYELISFADFIEKKKDTLLGLSTEIKTSKNFNEKNDRKMVLVGPEGGFSLEEICLMESLEIPLVKINRPIMRSETAFVFAQGLLEKV